MKIRMLMILACYSLSLLFVQNQVWASGFFLKSIGNVETGGQQISHWWYTSSNPVFHGEATPGSEVVADIDGTAQSINADSSGNWDYGASEMTPGDHQITFTSSGSTINFTLTIGNENVNWDAIGSGSAATMPTAGNSTPTILMLIGGLGIGIFGGRMIVNVNKE